MFQALLDRKKQGAKKKNPEPYGDGPGNFSYGREFFEPRSLLSSPLSKLTDPRDNVGILCRQARSAVIALYRFMQQARTPRRC